MARARRILFWSAGSRHGEGIGGGCGGGVGSGETALRTPKPEVGSADMTGRRDWGLVLGGGFEWPEGLGGLKLRWVGSELCGMNFSPVLAYMSFKLQFAAVFHFHLGSLR